MATDWKALEDAEDHAYFMAELMDISPESFTLEEKKQILHDMIASSSAIENAMRDEFAELDEGGTACARGPAWTARPGRAPW